MKMEIKLTELLASQNEAGRRVGYQAGYVEGLEAGLRLAAERVEKMIGERGSSRYDTCTAVLRGAKRRIEARVEDITPEGVRRHG